MFFEISSVPGTVQKLLLGLNVSVELAIAFAGYKLGNRNIRVKNRNKINGECKLVNKEYIIQDKDVILLTKF